MVTSPGSLKEVSGTRVSSSLDSLGSGHHVCGARRGRKEASLQRVQITVADLRYFPVLNASYNCVDRWAYKHPDKVGGEANRQRLGS